MARLDSIWFAPALLIALGCGSSPEVVDDETGSSEMHTVPVVNTPAPVDPVAALKAKLEAFPKKAAWVLRLSGMKPAAPHWIFSQVENAPVGFDVKKTDSLVSPLVGVITIRRHEFHNDGPFASSEEAAEPRPHDDELTDQTIITGTYAWQNEQWVFQSIEAQTHYGAGGRVGKKRHYSAQDLATDAIFNAWPFVNQISLSERSPVAPH